MSDSEYSDNEILNENEEEDEISLDDDSVSDDESIDNFEEDNEEENNIDNENDEDSLKNELININDDEDEYEDDDEDDDDENEEKKNQKFDEEQKKIIDEYYSDYYTHNYDEVVAMSKVIRDENNNIIDPFHRTVPIMTKYEIARILGVRTKQINSGANIFVKTSENIIDGYYIALQELKEKKIPFIIRRPIPGGKSEYWNISDLELLESF